MSRPLESAVRCQRGPRATHCAVGTLEGKGEWKEVKEKVKEKVREKVRSLQGKTENGELGRG
jgi:hypothetical protein